MTNIVSMKSISEIIGARVTIDTIQDIGIVVTLVDGAIFTFKPYDNGICYLDLNTGLSSNKFKDKLFNFSLS